MAGFRSRIESFFANLSKIFKRFNGDNNVRVTNLETYNIQLRLACVLYNINKFSDICNLDVLQKYRLWTTDSFDYPIENDIVPSLIKLEYKLNNINFMKSFQVDLLNSIMNDTGLHNDNNNLADNNNKNDNLYEIQYIIKHKIENGKKGILLNGKVIVKNIIHGLMKKILLKSICIIMILWKMIYKFI